MEYVKKKICKNKMHSEGKANRKERLEIRKSGLHTNACQDSETWDVNLENGI